MDVDVHALRGGLIPIDEPTTLERLDEEARVTPPNHERRPLPPRLVTSGTVSDLIAEQRR